MDFTFHLRTVTEIFAGAANVQNAELRPSAFRGPLRFWFRAMMGDIVGDDLPALHKLEALAFGATDMTSPFWLRVKHPAECSPRNILRETADSIGYNYLSFSMKERMCFPQDTAFQVTLHFRYPDPLIQRVVLGAFWLVLNFGGIGSRTRRSFGALSADRVEGTMPSSSEPSLPFEPPEKIVDHYQDGLAAVKQVFYDFAIKHQVTLQTARDPTFTTFRGWSGRVIYFWESVFEAQECLGRILRGFRNGGLLTIAPWDFQPRDLQRNTRTGDYLNIVASYLEKGATLPQNLNNDALGLPIVFFSSTRKRIEEQANQSSPAYNMRPWTATTQWKSPSESTWHDRRRASPLILRPIRLKNGHFAALIAAFPCQFLPSGAQQQLQPGEPKSYQPQQRYSPLPIQVCTQKDVEAVVARLFKQIDHHFGKESLCLP